METTNGSLSFLSGTEGDETETARTASFTVTHDNAV